MTRRSPSLIDKSALTPEQFEANLASIHARISTGATPQPAPRDALCPGGVDPDRDACQKALKSAIYHIEHMAAFITAQNCGYSFEGLGEDMPGIRAVVEKLKTAPRGAGGPG